jgi:hypothetical protein
MATSTNESSGNYRIDPLRGAENYTTWRVQISDILTDMGLWEYTTGTITKPTDPAKLEEWQKKDRKALTAIRLRVSNAMMAHVISSSTSKEAFDSLSNVFSNEGSLSLILLRRKFFHYLITDESDFEEEIRKIKAIWQQINLIDPGSIPDYDLASGILTSLPRTWDPLIVSIPLDRNLTSSSVISRILQEERRRKERSDEDTTLYASTQRTKRTTKSKFRSGVFCHGCGKEGHIRPECRKEAKKNEEKDKDKGKDQKDRKGDKAKGRRNYSHVAEDEDSASEPEEYAFAVEEEPTVSTRGTWLADSGTTSHIVSDRSLFINYTPVVSAIHGVGDCSSLGRGDVRIEFTTDRGTVPIILKDALHAPSMKFNLISLGRLTSAGLSYEGRGKDLLIKDGNKLIGRGTKSGYLYRMSVKPAPDVSMIARVHRSWYEWHCALGHVNKNQLREMHREGMVVGMDVDTSSDPDFFCEACIQAKHSRSPFPSKTLRIVSEIGELIFSDIWGPSSIASISGNRYMISFSDFKSRHVWVAHMKDRDETSAKLEELDAWLENHLKCRMKTLRVDNAKEYVKGATKAYADRRGIQLEPTSPYSPEYNGVAERLNRTLVEHARAMLIAHDLPKFLWEEATSYSAYLKNRSPTRALIKKTPFEALRSKKPDLSGIHEFGTDCWVRVNVRTSKLHPQSVKRTFVGIKESTVGWRYFVPESRSVLTSREVIFPARPALDAPIVDSVVVPASGLEGGPTSQPPPAPPTAPSTPVQSKTEPASPPLAVTRTRRNIARVDYFKANDGVQRTLRSLSTKSKTPSPPVSDLSVQGEISDESGAPDSTLSNLCFAALDLDIPQTLADVQARSDWPSWKEAMDKEMGQLEKLGTYTVEDLPADRKAIGCRWVFAIKRDSNGNILKYKARLVAQGFSQIPGQDFFATHAPVMRLETFRLLIAITARLDLELHQVDVVGAYLNSPLQEDIFMRQAPGYEDGTSRVYHLRKALYGLKQAGRAWRMEFDNILLQSLGFSRSQSDPCLYFRSTDSDLTLIGTHVDDCLLASTELQIIQDLKIDLRKYFDITDLGEAALYVGIQITRNRELGTITLSQAHYIDTILSRFGMESCNPVSTPLDSNVSLSPPSADDDLTTDFPFQAIIGSLMYAAVGTRPDISFAVQALSQFNVAHTPIHCTAAKHVLRYLKGTRDFGITYGDTSEFVITGYSDADWGQNRADRRSVSGYAFILGGGLVSWSSKKQSTVALSTMEAEYVALAHATKEAIWFRSILEELGFSTNGPTILATDNLAAISFAQDHQFHARSKHIDIRHHFVRERVLDGYIKIPHCSSEDNHADMLTKALPRIKHQEQLMLNKLAAR